MREPARGRLVLIAVLLAATAVRLVRLGQCSFWYDEVVTMRLARTASPAGMLGLLGEIDATRAPLHPLLLQGWIHVFGPSEFSSRALSAFCGVVTVALVYWVGLEAFNRATGLWAAWLCSMSPVLVYYARETRMYALLVMITCLAWGCLFAHRRSSRPVWCCLLALSQIALIYTHPLGLLMVAALVLVSLLFRQAIGITWRAWLLTHVSAALAVLPWISRYFDHEPESLSGTLPLRFLLGMPIGFIGGNSRTLVLFALVIAFGLIVSERRGQASPRFRLEHPVASAALLIWLVLPAATLYVYSRLAQPVFGPSRYTLFSGPAYLILVARGLARLPALLRYPAAAGSAILSGALLMSMVFRPDLKADWRSAAEFLNRDGSRGIVAVVSADPLKNVEYLSARYYLEPNWDAVPCPDHVRDLFKGETKVWLSIGLRDGTVVGNLPADFGGGRIVEESVSFPGLRLMKIKPDREPNGRKG